VSAFRNSICVRSIFLVQTISTAGGSNNPNFADGQTAVAPRAASRSGYAIRPSLEITRSVESTSPSQNFVNYASTSVYAFALESYLL
jgi:hypothetical protein